MAKQIKTAAEIAEIIRKKLGEEELRIGVFSNREGWHATVYAAPHAVAELQKRVDRLSQQLQAFYELQS